MDKFFIIGGVGAVGNGVEREITAFGTTERVSGADRFETSAAVAKKFFGKECEAIVLAYGLNFPDGLSGGPLAMTLGAPLLLATTDDIRNAQDYAKENNIKKVITLGGNALISDTSVNIIKGEIDGVFRTSSGKRYHFDTECGGKNSEETTITQAKSMGLTPCDKCAW